ncbi:hypothetical protein [Bradyrhizobium sp. SEMIA]|uniref:hypothetical protein n=1 Tax=Bradyrhizobium sp. SEMIA TaxID=2597515 RepID=UPI0018A41DA9|nr:hypothetical protein [Bradyrhizobium sp. SEMIA]QOG20404.1 hypothetical protein FOM02_26705 [Bradyrhizobium sp. SEMIA]
MISDVLSDAGDEIRRYMNEMPEVYVHHRQRIKRLLDDMDTLRIQLDTPPSAHEAVEQ